MSKYGLHGKLISKLGLRDDLIGILQQGVNVLMEKHSCHLYLISKGIGDKQTIWVTEVWETKADHDESLNDPEIRAIIAKAIPMLAEQPIGGTELEVIAGLPQ